MIHLEIAVCVLFAAYRALAVGFLNQTILAASTKGCWQ